MELFAHAARRWLMHGPGWFLHERYYCALVQFGAERPVRRDLRIRAAAGLKFGWWPGFAWIGAGIAACGPIYFGFHDAVVHQRVPNRYLLQSYMKRIGQAYRLHHVVGTKRRTVSLGSYALPNREILKADLKRRGRAEVREPRRSVEKA